MSVVHFVASLRSSFHIQYVVFCHLSLSLVTRERPAIDIRNGLQAEVHRGGYRHERELWNVGPQLIPSLARFTGLNSVPMHRKNKTVTIPGMISQTDKVSMDKRTIRLARRRISPRRGVRRKAPLT